MHFMYSTLILVLTTMMCVDASFTGAQPRTGFLIAGSSTDSGSGGGNYGASGCPCIGINEVEGETIASLKSGKKVPYPADIGARCDAWDADHHADCPGESWCKSKWCYVDPCNCKDLDILPKPSVVLPEAKYQGKPLHFSYATCGSKDTYSKEEEKKTAKDIEETCALKVDSNTWGKDDCRCVGIGPLWSGTTDVTIDGKSAQFPAHTGASCQPWEKYNHPECKGKSPPSWCSQSWCYVDPCKCKLKTPPKLSTYLEKANYQGKPVYWSYATCGGVDSYTASKNKGACVNQKSSEDCGKLKKCAWHEEKCVGKELADACK